MLPPSIQFSSPSYRWAPEQAVQQPINETLRFLEQRLGPSLYEALEPGARIPGPVAAARDSTWIKTVNMVGINVRTVATFWQVIPYVLTLPTAQNSIHILPIWEPGVAGSLYGPASWNVNPEFYSPDLARACPALVTVEQQLQAVVNLLHLLGKTVGLDVVPHCDRFSEIVLAQPAVFEWLQREDRAIVRHSTQLYSEVEELIFQWFCEKGSTVPPAPHLDFLPGSAAELFSPAFPETERLRMLFGEVSDYQGRLQRRLHLIQRLYERGLETVPATMGPPYRGLEVDPSPQAIHLDEAGRTWRDYRITRPEPQSRVFGPLTRYRLYERKKRRQPGLGP